MKLLLKASFSRVTGYGNDGIDIARHLDKAGVDVRVMPQYFLPPVPEDFAHLLTKPLDKTDYDVALQFLPPFFISVREKTSNTHRQQGVPRKVARLHVGWSMWETSLLERRDMTGHGLGADPWKLLDLMYVTWPGCADAFRNFAPDLTYRVLPCGIDGDLYPVVRRQTKGTTKFCMIGELHQRKDPFVAIDAFRELKEEHGDEFDAQLNLKSSIGGLHPDLEDWTPGIKVHQGIWPYEELIRWMQDMDCYLGPSRGEGNLKPPMEFMATGGTVIVTNWSGPTNWLHPDVAYPLRYTLMPNDPARPDGPMMARADKEHLKELMWHVHTHRAEAANKGILAASWIRQVADWKQVIEKLILQLERDLA